MRPLSSQTHLVEIGEQPELACEITAEEDVMMSLDHTRILAVRDFDLDVRCAPTHGRHIVRLPDPPSVYVQGRRPA